MLDRRTAAWARDRPWHPSQRTTRLRGGRLGLVLEVADTRKLLGWILSFGAGVRVIRPAALRDAVRAEAARIVRAPVR